MKKLKIKYENQVFNRSYECLFNYWDAGLVLLIVLAFTDLICLPLDILSGIKIYLKQEDTQ